MQAHSSGTWLQSFHIACGKTNTTESKSNKAIWTDHAKRFQKQPQAPPTHCDIIIYKSTDLHFKTHMHWCSAKIHTSPIIHEFEDLALRMRWNSSDWMYSSCSRFFFWAGSSSSSPVEFSSDTADGFLAEWVPQRKANKLQIVNYKTDMSVPLGVERLRSTRSAMSSLLGRLRFTAFGSSLTMTEPLPWSFLTAAN